MGLNNTIKSTYINIYGINIQEILQCMAWKWWQSEDVSYSVPFHITHLFT